MENENPPLTSLVILPETSNPSPEDIFSSSLGLIGPYGARNSHGEPGASIIYKSKKFGDIQLSLANPEKQKERFLMAHYLWNASLLVSEFISGFGVRGTLAAEVGWSVNGKKVIELGAGSGLVSIITALAGAREVVVTDYPDPDLLSTIRKNIGRNIPGYLSQKIVFEGHEWGVLEIQPAKDYRNVFDIVIAADCFWIPAEHSNLITSMQHFLSRSVDARIWAVAGFHTGRGVLAQFLDHAKEVSLTVEKVWERDMFGLERDFVHSEEERREDTTERSKWLMIAVLRRRVQGDGE